MTEKKLKKAAKDIKMPDELKNRIMTQCLNAPAPESSDSGDEQVFVVEHSRMHRITRTIASIAACAVLVSVIGTTGYLMSRQDPNTPDPSVSDEQPYTEPTESNQPFGNLSGLEMSIRRYDSSESIRIRSDLRDPIVDFFNTMEWTETDIDFAGSFDRNTEEYYIEIERHDPVTDEINHEIFTVTSTGFLIYSAPNADVKAYDVDYDSLVTLLKIAYEGSRDELPEDQAMMRAYDSCPFGSLDRYFEMLNIEMTDEKLTQFMAALGSEEWTEIDYLPAYARRHGDIFGGMYKDGDTFYQMSITQTGCMIFTATDGYGNVKAGPVVYKINADSIREKFNRIAYGEGVTGKDAPFTGNELIEYASVMGEDEDYPIPPNVSAEIKSILSEHYWVELPASSIDDTDEYSLALNSSSSSLLIGRKYIMYVTGTGTKFYDIYQVDGISADGVYRSLRELLTGTILGLNSAYPPFVGISKEDFDLMCESGSGAAMLTTDDLAELENAMSSLNWNKYETYPKFSYEDEGHELIASIYSTSQEDGKQFALLFFDDNTVEYHRSSSDGMPVLRYTNVLGMGADVSEIITQFAENVMNADMTIEDLT